ncbi:MAG: hypothetical protein AABX11_05495 [Nanoarchaeota archaeon]
MIIEEDGRMKMTNLVTGNLEYLSNEAEEMCRYIIAKREEAERRSLPEEILKQKEASDTFFKEYGIHIRTEALIDMLSKNKDPRLETIINIRNGARMLFIINNPQHHPHSTNVQIAGANAIFSYLETEHPDLYQYVQTICNWLNEGEK